MGNVSHQSVTCLTEKFPRPVPRSTGLPEAPRRRAHADTARGERRHVAMHRLSQTISCGKTKGAYPKNRKRRQGTPIWLGVKASAAIF